MDRVPIVSIICLTYNHEKYVCNCLEGFLSQKINFPIEILVNDDASSDNTKNILLDYQKQYPGKITVLFHEKNQYSDPNCGHQQIIANLLEIAQGRYLAFCEGDDYWCDDNKLKKQIEFLESNNMYSALYHNVNIVNQYGESVQHNGFFQYLSEHECDLSLLFNYGQIGGQLSSLVCRNFWRDFSEPVKKRFISSFANGDQLLYAINCVFGKVLYQESQMSTYRHITDSGTSWSATTRGKNMYLFRYNAISSVQRFLKECFSVEINANPYLDEIALDSFIVSLKYRTKENIRIYCEIHRMHKRTIPMVKKLFARIVGKIHNA